jgi:hypothetical protein
MGCLEGSGVPVLYIGRTVLKGYKDNVRNDGTAWLPASREQHNTGHARCVLNN